MDANILLKFNLENRHFIINNLIKSKNNSIYSGKSGIIIYLLELYSITSDENLLSESQQIADIIYSDLNQNTSYAFFTGNMGVANSFLQVYHHTLNEKYLKYCLDIAKKSKNHLALASDPIDDLLNGVSGILLALLHIYSTGHTEKWILEDINFYTNYLLDKTYLSEKGNIYWDITSRINRGLTGFSHGASGIGFVFNELYKLSGNKDFKEVFLSTLRYEDQYYDEEIYNWLDFRRFPHKKEDDIIFETQAKSNNKNFFLEKKHMFAWCHGAPGIIGIRENIDYEIIEAINSSIENSKNHSLCHSGTGNLLCLMENKTINTETYKSLFETKSEELISYYTKHKSFINGYSDPKMIDFGLFMGDLGVLYFLLKAYKFMTDTPDNTINILFPRVSRRITESIPIFNKDIFHRIIKSSFPKTVSLISSKYPEVIFVKEDLQIENFEKKIKLLNNEIINDVFTLEKNVKQVECSIESHSYEFFRSSTDLNFFKLNLKNSTLEDVNLNVRYNVRFVKTKWDWDPLSNVKWTLNDYSNSDQYEYAIVPNFENMIISLSNVQKYIIDYLIGKNVSIEELVNYFYGIIDNSSNNKRLIKEKIITNVFYLLKSRVLEIVYEKV